MEFIRRLRVPPIDNTLDAALHQKIDQKTKPLGALGQLERLAFQVARIQGTMTPTLKNPYILVFAGDHGVAKSGVSAYPQDVTWQMVHNFLQGGAAINVFARQHNISMRVIDAGVNHEFEDHPQLVKGKIGPGTENFLEQPAMSEELCEKALRLGAAQVDAIAEEGCNVLGFGEMGIGNTSSASMLMSYLLDVPLDHCVGRGTGLSDEQFERKVNLLQQAAEKYPDLKSPIDILQTFAGFEIVAMVGGILRAAQNRMLVLIDGFIATAAYLAAYKLAPAIGEYAIFCHRSMEQGHQHMLEALKADPILKMDLRLGEGTGCALAYPLLQSSLNFFNEMASFADAGVSEKS
ncbi:nicotinate-nucleotide--dimethylbenzimidazole phosphoribosyltransferase [Hahella aquimaris]|uniref:nicotinate-nucleotide--dimethylbenzimidazole phosphoribosyltransferase n=1 Tax=Hahella sp. HNIBRBA332 TaxID=3015983 RepID=UPI00273B38C9|nr:nicotinate-nucleotide--dimethylbenzimidazole phosphoribosyltransferase [Hahella sp. HNIBRBA332]WLQ12286.1 nicotinate-nucleotide--dimethylbenzimidazole phosphoribosyltransferase [Hahella sp. HNIBRBA332]